MAAEMAEKGLSVHLLDVTEKMGRWTPEDWEGPFGLFIFEEMTDLQKERLTEGDYLDSVDHGFTLWLEDGPLDMRGPIFPYRFQKKGYSENLKNYLQTSSLGKENSKETQVIGAMDFDKNWLAHFAHQLSANVFKDNPQGMDYGKPLPLLSSYHIRRVSHRGYQKGLDWVRSKGVQVTSFVVIKDLFLQKGQCWELEISEAEKTLEGPTSTGSLKNPCSSESSKPLKPINLFGVSAVKSRKFLCLGSLKNYFPKVLYRLNGIGCATG